MTLKEAKKYLAVANNPIAWANENSSFHTENTISIKEECIWNYLEALKIVTREEALNLN